MADLFAGASATHGCIGITFCPGKHDREGAAQLSGALANAIGRMRHCALCDTCASAQRDHSLLCVVETPADQLAIEQAYR